MLTTTGAVCRRQYLALPFLFPHSVQARLYTQQRTARTPRSTPQQSTTNPSSSAQVKNRNLAPPATGTTAAGAGKHGGKMSVNSVNSVQSVQSVADDKVFARVRQAEMAREMDHGGQQLEMIRMSVKAGVDPWGAKAVLMDLRIPSKPTSFGAIRDNWNNMVQNVISMYRLASDFAFPGIITKLRISPQLFRTMSTSEKAWVAPFRKELLDVYTSINQAIASGDKKTLTKLTAYEYQAHIFQLLHRNSSRASASGLSYNWTLTKLLSPVRILSLRAYPLYSAREEPSHGNRNCVQALVRFETLQTLTVRNARGQAVRPDGSVADDGWMPEPRRVLEYLICENKMFYRDGWYVRDQAFEGVKSKFKDIAVD